MKWDLQAQIYADEGKYGVETMERQTGFKTPMRHELSVGKRPEWKKEVMRQNCLKAAATVVAGMQTDKTDSLRFDLATTEVIKMARKFAEYVESD